MTTATPRKRLIPRQVVDLANNLAIDLDSLGLVRFLECGLHSGYPACCVGFFTLIWQEAAYEFWPEDDEDDEDDEVTAGQLIWMNYRTALDRYEKVHGNIGYIPCPACFLARNFVESKSCNCSRKLQRGQVYPWMHPVEPGCVLVGRDGKPRMTCGVPSRN